MTSSVGAGCVPTEEIFDKVTMGVVQYIKQKPGQIMSKIVWEMKIGKYTIKKFKHSTTELSVLPLFVEICSRENFYE